MSYFPAGVTSDNPVYIDLTTAMAATIDSIEAVLSTRGISEGTATLLTPKFAIANVAASQTDAALVTAVASKKLRVLALFALTAGTATNVTVNSKPAGAGVAISPLLAFGINGGIVLPFNPVGWFQSVAGEGLTVTTGAGSTTGIGVVYVEAA